MLKLQELINAAVVESMKTGAPIPQYVQNLIDNQNVLQLQRQGEQIDMMENELQISDMEVMMQGGGEQEQSVEAPQEQEQQMEEQA